MMSVVPRMIALPSAVTCNEQNIPYAEATRYFGSPVHHTSQEHYAYSASPTEIELMRLVPSEADNVARLSRFEAAYAMLMDDGCIRRDGRAALTDLLDQMGVSSGADLIYLESCHIDQLADFFKVAKGPKFRECLNHH